MGRQAENSCTLPDGRVVGYGLLKRGGFWHVRFSDGGQRVYRGTGADNKGEARVRAKAVITAYFVPTPVEPVAATWDAALAELAGVPHLRPNTVRSYAKAVAVLRRVLPQPPGPAAVTADHATLFARKYRPKSANTVRNVLRHLSSLWAKHLKPLKLVTSNPWADVPPPPVVKSTPRAPTAADLDAFLDALERRYPGWELIRTFVVVKAFVGCRTMDLCQVKTAQLRDGRLHFAAEQTKTRTARSVPLPPDLFATLQRLSGPTWLWERFADDARVRRRNRKKSAAEPFTPDRLYHTVGNLFAEYNRSRPGEPRLRAHDLRRAALTAAALRYGVDAAAKAIGVDPQTARRYYIDGAQAFNSDAVYAGMAD